MSVAMIEELYTKQYSNLVNRFANRAGDHINAEDVVQEGFARALKYVRTWRGEGIDALENWVNNIILNACRDFNQEERMQGVVREPLQHVEEEGTKSLDFQMYTSQTVENILREMEAKGGDHATILKLHIVEGYTYDEVAEQVLDHTPKAIEHMCLRFKRMLREKYGDQ